MPFQIKIKPTSGGANVVVSTDNGTLISELKEAVAAEASIPAAEQRLIYKGQVLKNERSVESYGIQAEHVIHLVKSKPPASSDSPSPTAAGATPSQQTSPLFGMGSQGQGQGPLAGLPGGMNNPMVQGLLQNPELLRTLLHANPGIRQLMDSNPEMAHILNNPQLLREQLNVAANPSLLREQARHSDRALSNLEAHPEGFNALRRMYENVQQPLQDAATGGGGAGAGNPFASLFQNQGLPGAQGAQTPASEAPSETPNTAPLPNPWAPDAASPAGSQGAGTGANLMGLGGFPGMGSLAGLGAEGLASPSSQSREDAEAQGRQALAMLSNPAMRQAMAQFMSTEQGIRATQAMAESHPQMRSIMDANPALRAAMQDPETLRRMMTLEHLQGMMGQTNQGQPAQGGGQAGGLPGMDLGALAGMFGGGGGGGGGTGAGGIDMGALQALMSGMGGMGGAGGGLGGLGIPPVPNPEVAFATQLSQLQDMGFFDQQENIVALQATGGNVQAAVDRLLNAP